MPSHPHVALIPSLPHGCRATPCLPSCCSSRHGDLTSLLRRLPHRINQARQVHRRLKGGVARGDIARADRPGKTRIQLANIVRRTLGHILGHIAIARGNLRLKLAIGACPLRWTVPTAGTHPPWPRDTLTSIDFETIATASPGMLATWTEATARSSVPADQNVSGAVTSTGADILKPLWHLGRDHGGDMTKISHDKAHGIDGVPGGDG